jgi:hypothetical protein
MNSLSLGKNIRTKVFHMAYKVPRNQPISNCEDTVNVQKLTGTNKGHIVQPTNTCINTAKHIASEMRNNLSIKTEFSRQNILQH